MATFDFFFGGIAASYPYLQVAMISGETVMDKYKINSMDFTAASSTNFVLMHMQQAGPADHQHARKDAKS